MWGGCWAGGVGGVGMERGIRLALEQRSPNLVSALLSFISLQFILGENRLLLGEISLFPGAPKLAAQLRGEEGLIGECWSQSGTSGSSELRGVESRAGLSRAKPSWASYPTPHLGSAHGVADTKDSDGSKASPARVCSRSHGCRVILWAGELHFPAQAGKIKKLGKSGSDKKFHSEQNPVEA